MVKKTLINVQRQLLTDDKNDSFNRFPTRQDLFWSQLAMPGVPHLFRNPATQFEITRLFVIQVIIMNIDSDRINFNFSRSVAPHWAKCCIPSSGFPLYGSPHKTAGMESGAGNWKWGSCCDAATKVPAAISSERAGLVHADRCAFALSNLSHGPLGENSSRAVMQW